VFLPRYAVHAIPWRDRALALERAKSFEQVPDGGAYLAAWSSVIGRRPAEVRIIEQKTISNLIDWGPGPVRLQNDVDVRGEIAFVWL